MPQLSWAPPLWRVVLYAVSGTSLIILAALGPWMDPEGRLLVGVAGVGFAGLAVRDAVARPAVRADLAGLEIHDGTSRHILPWVAVRSVRAQTIRHGRRLVLVPTLEVDTIDGLYILSRRQLGHDPLAVADDLEKLRLSAS